MKKTLISILVLTSLSAHAQETKYVKNNHLCIKDVCIGDDVKDLKSIKFNAARTDIGDNRLLSSMKSSNNDVAKFIATYMSSATKSVSPEIVKYFVFNKFDSNVIDMLTKEKGFCKTNGDLAGTFVTESGIRTTLYINIRVENDYTQQSWRVVGIRQNFPNDMTWAQREQMTKIFLERYKQRDSSNPYLGWTFSGGDLVLSEIADTSGASTRIGRESHEDKLLKFRGCGTKVLVD